MTIGSRLRAARDARGDSQQDAAVVIGCSVKAVWDWEAANREPKGAYLRAVEAYIADAPVEAAEGGGA